MRYRKIKFPQLVSDRTRIQTQTTRFQSPLLTVMLFSLSDNDQPWMWAPSRQPLSSNTHAQKEKCTHSKKYTHTCISISFKVKSCHCLWKEAEGDDGGVGRGEKGQLAGGLGWSYLTAGEWCGSCAWDMPKPAWAHFLLCPTPVQGYMGNPRRPIPPTVDGEDRKNWARQASISTPFGQLADLQVMKRFWGFVSARQYRCLLHYFIFSQASWSISWLSFLQPPCENSPVWKGSPD